MTVYAVRVSSAAIWNLEFANPVLSSAVWHWLAHGMAGASCRIYKCSRTSSYRYNCLYDSASTRNGRWRCIGQVARSIHHLRDHRAVPSTSVYGPGHFARVYAAASGGVQTGNRTPDRFRGASGAFHNARQRIGTRQPVPGASR